MGNEKSYQQITKTILEYLDEPSKFRYYEGLDMQLTKYSLIKSYDEVERNILLEIVARSDLALLSIIADFGYCDARMLQTRLIELKTKHPDIIYPSHELDHMKSMLKRLCKSSLVRAFTYNVENSTSVIIIYCITDAGAEIVRRYFYHNHEVPILNSLFPPHEVFKRLSANYTAITLHAMSFVDSYVLGRMEYIGGGFGKEYIYSTLKGTRYGIPFNIVVEPVFFSVNKSMITEENLNQAIEKRMDMLNKMITLPAYKNCYIVFVVEDKDSLKKVVNLARKHLSNTKKEMIYFTGENVIYKSKSFDILLQISEFTESGFKLIGGNNDFVE